ncbi:hypothetical protein MJ585_01700 [Klebsiella pneumoniae]|nr:hypothetical protein MJ585_01700 [Klebsiella pneumoniae]
MMNSEQRLSDSRETRHRARQPYFRTQQIGGVDEQNRQSLHGLLDAANSWRVPPPGAGELWPGGA